MKLRYCISSRLRVLRAVTGMTQLELARSAGLSKIEVSFLECGRRSPSLETVIKLCRALNTTVDVFLETES